MDNKLLKTKIKIKKNLRTVLVSIVLHVVLFLSRVNVRKGLRNGWNENNDSWARRIIRIPSTGLLRDYLRVSKWYV